MLGDARVLPHLIEAVARVVPLCRALAAIGESSHKVETL